MWRFAATLPRATAGHLLRGTIEGGDEAGIARGREGIEYGRLTLTPNSDSLCALGSERRLQ